MQHLDRHSFPNTLRVPSCTTQAELDAKVAAMEAEISHGQLPLREEKQMVRDISRLKSQRDRVREAEGRQATVGGGPNGAGARLHV